MKTLVLVLCTFLASSAQAFNTYQLLDKIGSCTDFIYAKGSLSKGSEELFKETARSLGLEDRDIKPRNSGLLLRLLFGYNNALAVQLFNRVYFNDSCLEKMSDGEKKFLMAHELSHHKHHDSWKIIVLSMFKKFIDGSVNSSIAPKVDVKVHSPFYYRYILEGFTLPMFVEFSLKSLIYAQILQKIEIEADRSAIRKGGATVEDGTECLRKLYYPDTEDWPLYAKISSKIQSFLMPIMSLPFIKEHMPHLTSFEDRVTRLSAVR